VPIARFVEAEDAVVQRREAETVEAGPAVAVRGQATGVSRKEQQICVAPGAVGAMPGMCASVGGRQITDAERAAARKSIGYCARRSLDRAHQRGGSETGPLSGTQPAIAVAPICQADRVMEVSAIGGTNRDRLPRREGLGHTGADRRDYRRRKKPNHSKCMIAHGSA